MHAAATLFVWTMRLACWPFEVEGQGRSGAEATPPAGRGVAAPADPAVPSAPPASLPLPPSRPPPTPVSPSPPLFEEARYEVRYGILGSVGALRFSARGLAPAADGSRVVHIHGSGEGAVLGLGAIQRRIESEFDPGTLGPRRWSTLRLRDGQRDGEGIVDSGARGAGGTLLLQRLKPGEPLERQTVAFAVPTSDPLSLLWRLRTAPPPLGQTETMQLLDGLALWRVRITTVAVGTNAPDREPTPAIRLDGELDPVFYDGRSDPERPNRRFTLWLSEDVGHLPLRLEMPLGLADVVMTLAEARKLAATAQPSVPLPGARNL